jgi:hypothetical protein
MSNASVKVAIALFVFLTLPAASFARGGGGHGGGHAGFGAIGGLFPRAAGSAGTGNVPISGIPRGPGNAGGINNVKVDPSGIGNAARIATLPQPSIAAPSLPAGSRNPVAPPSMNIEPQALGEISGGHSQPRADQVPSESNLTNPNDPINRENAALDRMINGICRGC